MAIHAIYIVSQVDCKISKSNGINRRPDPASRLIDNCLGVCVYPVVCNRILSLKDINISDYEGVGFKEEEEGM